MKSAIRTLILAAAVSFGTMADQKAEAQIFSYSSPRVGINVGWGGGVQVFRPAYYAPATGYYVQPIGSRVIVPQPVVVQQRPIVVQQRPVFVQQRPIVYQPVVQPVVPVYRGFSFRSRRFRDKIEIKRGGLEYEYRYHPGLGRYILTDIDD